MQEAAEASSEKRRQNAEKKREEDRAEALAALEAAQRELEEANKEVETAQREFDRTGSDDARATLTAAQDRRITCEQVQEERQKALDALEGN